MAGLRQVVHNDQGDHERLLFHPLTLSPYHLVMLVLAVLFFGPLIAPLFQATQLPLLADSGALAHDVLAHYICPTPAKSYVLLGFPMAVCARCWGATIGLWAAWHFTRPPTTDHRPTFASICSSFVVGRSSFASTRSSFVVGRWSFVMQWLHSY